MVRPVKEPVPPEALAFARAMRDVFGPGVKLRKGLPWPGGVNAGRKGR